MAGASSGPDDLRSDVLLAWLSQLKAMESAEEEPTPYASPPCYLAEFSDADFADHTAQ